MPPRLCRRLGRASGGDYHALDMTSHDPHQPEGESRRQPRDDQHLPDPSHPTSKTGHEAETDEDGTYELHLPTDDEPSTPSADAASSSEASPRVPLYPELEQEDRFCMACGGSLRGVEEYECPHCSHAFDPNDSSTYRNRPPLDTALDPAAARAEAIRVKLGLGGILALLLIGRLVVVLAAGDQAAMGLGRLTLLVTHPFWIAAVVWLSFGLIRNERLHGLVFWMLSGAAIGGIIGSLEGAWYLGSGVVIGLFAGILREYLDLLRR